MNENLDLGKILDNTMRGIKLYCPMFGAVELFLVMDKQKTIQVKYRGLHWDFGFDGRYAEGDSNCEISLFPSRENRDWSKFKAEPPMIDGGIYVVTKKDSPDKWIYAYHRHPFITNRTYHYIAICLYNNNKEYSIYNKEGLIYNNISKVEVRKANNHEIDLFHQKLAQGGYWWDAKNKRVEKLKFKEGDIIKPVDNDHISRVNKVGINKYECTLSLYDMTFDLPFNRECKWEIAKERNPQQSSTCCGGTSISKTAVEAAHPLYYYQVTENTENNRLMRDELVRLSNAEVPTVDKENIYAPGDLIYNDRRTLKICKYGSKMYRTVYLFGMEISIPKN